MDSPRQSGATHKKPIAFLAGALVFLALYVISLHNYLLFHSLAEMFSIVVAFGIFAVAWNTRQFHKSSCLTFLGIAYLSIAVLDIFHTLAYPGMGVFPGGGADLAAQLWIAARSMEALSLLIAFLLVGHRLNAYLVALVYAIVTSLLLASIFSLGVFPTCFVEGEGLTAFKKIAEYVICAILLLAILRLRQKRADFTGAVFALLIVSLAVTICSELAFTLYASPYGTANLIGHLLKVLSYYFIYKAIIDRGLLTPYELVFRDLKKSESRYRAVVEDQTELICRFLPDTTLTFVNDAYCQYFGKKREDLLGRSFISLLPVEEHEEVRAHLDGITRQNPVATQEQRTLSPDGEAHWQQWTNRALYDEKGNLTEFQAVGRDITDRKQAEEALREARSTLERRVQERTAELQQTVDVLQGEVRDRMRAEETLDRSEERYRTLFQGIGDGILVHDEDGVILDANDVACERFGRGMAELKGMKVQELVDKEHAGGVLSHARKTLTEGKDTFETVYVSRSGATTPCEVLEHVITYGHRPAILSVSRDITQRKRTERKILAHQSALRSLSARLSQTEERERRRFATALHDILSQTLAFAVMSLESIQEKVTADVAEPLGEISERIRRAVEATRSLTFELSPPILHQAGLRAALVSLAQLFGEEHSLAVSIEDDGSLTPLSEDVRIFLYRAVRELLVNIVKHAHAQSATVSIQRNGNAIEIEVKDNGRGFDTPGRGRVGEKEDAFGLFSIYERMESLGGECVIESAPGRGTCVTLRAPLSNIEETTPED